MQFSFAKSLVQEITPDSLTDGKPTTWISISSPTPRLKMRPHHQTYISVLFRTHHETEFYESARLTWWRIHQVWTQMFMYTARLVTVACGNHLLSAVTAGYAVGNLCRHMTRNNWNKSFLFNTNSVKQ